ncbi:AMIN-like domain-containing (lipo)protein [Pseudactinotalea sp.]|uniref:AMIN-like domain-containing (lipo)protein n=1 Tax=Pseudactinotalea sp. TaxID=1926260 RepID=UPI003B3A3139
MRRGTIRTLLTLAATASLVTACGTGGGDDPTSDPTDEPTSAATSDEPTTDEPTTEDPTEETPSGEDADGPAWPETTDDQANEAFESELVLTDVRVAEHADFDRLVLEFEGDGEPGWRVGYVEEAVREGSGESITLDGDAILQVSATHIMATDMSAYYDGPQQFDPDTEVIDDVFVDGSFEGYSTVYLGLDDVEIFRVFTLSEPSRLVVDVQDLDS